MYWNPPANGTIIDVQIEETPGQEGIYYIAESYEGQRVDRELIKLYPRHRKEFRLIVEEIGSLRFTPKSPVIVLFSLDDNTFRIMC